VRIFGVDFRFHSAGDVFTHGLAYAATALGLPYAHADVDDPSLASQVEAFAPELVIVVHGRRMATRYRPILKRWPSAVWLLDEPYETDETQKWSHLYTHVFVNDPATVGDHPHAAVVPTCFDPGVHFAGTSRRPYRVGFIGGTNATREMYLVALGDRVDLLVGEFRHPALARRARAKTVRPAEAADLYRQTRIVLNVFRDVHHYNRRHVAATALNPRIYEATACGALVVSDARPACALEAPSVPTFTTAAECVALVDTYLADPAARAARLAYCRRELAGATYAARLRTMLDVVAARAREVA
jgi:hypothetical protein